MTDETHTVETDDSTDEIKAPENWHFGIGDRSSHHYTYSLYTNQALYDDGPFGWECEIYWDQGHTHVVTFLPITRLESNGDVGYGYPTHTREFETEMDALQYAVEKAAELR